MSRHEVAKLESLQEANMAVTFLKRHGVDARLVDADLLRGPLLSPRVTARYGITAPSLQLRHATALMAGIEDGRLVENKDRVSGDAALARGRERQAAAEPIKAELVPAASSAGEGERMLLAICAFGILLLVLMQIWALVR